MSTRKANDIEYLSENSLNHLSHKRRELHVQQWAELVAWLKEEGKYPARNVGYSDTSARTKARRIHQVFKHAWATGDSEITPEVADEFLSSLARDEITTQRGNTYADSSKRKFVNALETYFRFIGTEWDPEIRFSDGPPECPSDPLTRNERNALLDAALDYQTPPSYGNLSPEERNRWKAHIAEILGKPKPEVTPADWKELRNNWKIPSLISTALDLGARAKLIERLRRQHLDLNNSEVSIPSSIAVKNDRSWTNALTQRTIRLLQRWDDQRRNYPEYDDDSHLWLNRYGNPYNSQSLNHLLSRLLDNAGIEAGRRKLTWHSLRHSTGCYVYEERGDLGSVADILRHEDLKSARRYCHPTPESQRGVLEDINGGGDS